MSVVNAGGKRAEQASQTRRKIIAAAGELFVEQGYAATTLQQVADRAGVAVQTIYFVFRNKRTLLKELADVTVAGDDEPVATMDRPWFREAMAAGPAEEHLRRHVHGTRLILDRVAAIAAMTQTAAATNPEVASLWTPAEDPRFTVQLAAARSLAGKPGARPGLSAQRAADLLYAMLSPALYLVLVSDRGWPPEEFEDWAFHTLRDQLCEPEPEPRPAR
ncbi:MAG TPA: helix-turn-helix domain-containing protein [Trebonia sp.]|nr:helix-turn-helix domain-containing protein [Trebonia sp.]